ncbi:MAG: hypothetical protein JNL94_18610 [Planctomycetes bacterium]|nr:hypothetical protein [Planctomycetota bacterium]
MTWMTALLCCALGVPQDAAADGTVGSDPRTGRGFTFTKDERSAIDAMAKDARAEDSAFVVRSKNFTVKAPNSARFAAELGAFLDLFQTEFFARIDAKPQVDVVPTVVVYATPAELGTKCWNGERAAFFWLNKEKSWPEFHVYTALETPKLDSIADVDVRPLQRGVARALLRRIAGRAAVPTWLEEGIAAWCEGLDVRADFAADRTLRCRRSPYLPRVRALLESSAETLTLERLFAFRVEEWNTDGFTEQTYRRNAQAEAFVDLLLATDVAKRERKAVFEALRRGVPLDKLEAKELRALERKWLDHMRELGEFFRLG